MKTAKIMMLAVLLAFGNAVAIAVDIDEVMRLKESGHIMSLEDLLFRDALSKSNWSVRAADMFMK
jgi:hypothetical protein